MSFHPTSSGQAMYRSDWRGTQPESQDYRRSVSPQLQQDYERTQRVLDQVRARSREQQYMNPSGGNGYERHGGSPQRYSPKRDSAAMEPMQTSYNKHPSVRRNVHSTLQEA